MLVDDLVISGVRSVIYVVGGAAIMLHVEREALTNDVDVLHSSTEIQASVRRVSEAKRWPESWLNDAAKMWASHYDGEDDWEIRCTRGDVSVQVAQPLLLLAMKLLAGRGLRDAADIDLLLVECHIGSLEEAEAVFDKYYPTEKIAPRALRQLHERFDDTNNP
ncbi:MAG: hypothetical protein JWM55_1940 [Acidimicrobiaceae bacterium]|nr:hypothetical protein [Acidimicrobiaceae bacterium]